MKTGHFLVAAALIIAVAAQSAARAAADALPLPQRLSDTGLFLPGTTTARAEHIAFSPQYPLWSDGTAKRRWISLPPGTSIDASQPDSWEFPVGTRLWKEFAFGHAIETRYIERLADGSWRFATYVWNADGTEAELAPVRGTALEVAAAPGGRYAIPSRGDCLACHEGGPTPVLGFSALQLSPDRDPLAPHADPGSPEHPDLRTLAATGVIRNLPRKLLDEPPRIAARSPTARAALGYLHGNCGHCHNDSGALASVDLSLAQQAASPSDSAARTLKSLLGHSSRFRPHDGKVSQRVVAGADEQSVLAVRMKTTNPMARMPPLGVKVADEEGIALIERWIKTALPTNEEKRP
jgi:hypothetical protein